MSDEPKRFPHVPGMCPATMKLIERLKIGKPPDELTDSELRQITGRDCSSRGKGQNCLYSAIRYCERWHGVVWRRVRTAGRIRCLAAGETIDVAKGGLRSLHRRSKRMVRMVSEYAGPFSTDERVGATVMLAQYGTLAALSSSQATKQLAAQKAAQPVNLPRLLEAFG